MTCADLGAVMDIQRACYGDMFVEGAAVFERRLCVAGDTAWVMVDTHNGVGAYLSAYPSSFGAVTALHGDFLPAGAQANTLYLHDLAVAPHARGHGLGQHLAHVALRWAHTHRSRHCALVAVQGARSFWQRQGYAAFALAGPEQQVLLSTYGDDAVYMVRAIEDSAP